MRRFKKLLVGALSVLTFGVLAFTSANVVKATSLTYGTDVVTSAAYSGDTRTWGFTTNLPSSNTNIAVGSDINGIVSAKDGTNGSNSAPIAIKSAASNAYDTYPGAEFLVPVPSADSTGTVTRTGNANNSRYLALGSNTPVALAASMTFDFGTSDIEENPTLSNNSTVTGYYLRFVVSGGEAKTYGISVQLKDGTTTYGAAATLYTVTYMDGASTLKTDAEAAEGSNISYTPKKYGYDFEGWYTDSTLQTKIASTYTVTANVTLYANWTAWTNTGIEEYTLSNAAIEKIATGIDGNLSADLALTPSIYTAMTGVGMTTTSVTLPGASSATQAPCFNTNGAVNTNGNGLKFTAPANGTLTAYVGSGGGSQRNIKLTDGTNVLEPTTGSTVVGNVESARYTPVEIVYTLEEGTTYYFGGDNGVRIYYISFVQTATTADSANLDANNSTGESTTIPGTTAVRFVGRITGVDELDIESIEATITGDSSVNKTFTTVYTAITNISGCEAADNTYYFYYTIYGVTNEYNGKTISFTYTVTFADGSVKTLATANTYTIAL